MAGIDLRFYLSLFMRRLPYVLLIVIAFTAAGIILAKSLPSVYRASARILVEAPQISSDLARTTVPVGPWEQMQIIQQRLTTRDNLLDLAKRLDVYADSETMPDDDDVVDDMRKRTSFQLLEMDAPRGAAGVTMLSVSFDAKDPELAARVVNSFVTQIVDRNSVVRAGLANDALRFFQQEVVRLGSDLSGVEKEILDFKNANQSALPESLDFRRAQQANQQERLLMLSREEASLRDRRESLVRLYETTGRVASGGPVTPEQQMLEDLKRSLASQLMIFADGSPTIVALRARIKAAEDRLRGTQPDAAAGAAPSALDLQLSEIDDRLSMIDREKTAITDNLAALEKSIAATPANDTALSALQRNRDNIQNQYNIATARLAEASTGEQIENSARGGRLSLVEPATAPSDPVSPHRMRIAAAGLALGFLTGIGLVILLELLNKTIRRPSELIALFETESLGAIPYIRTIEEVRSGRRRMAVASLALIVAVPLMAYSAQRYMPADMLGKVVSIGRGPAM
jgi:polysaccharide chain length determinant protein (PEP-CTERM system associated)